MAPRAFQTHRTGACTQCWVALKWLGYLEPKVREEASLFSGEGKKLETQPHDCQVAKNEWVSATDVVFWCRWLAGMSCTNSVAGPTENRMAEGAAPATAATSGPRVVLVRAGGGGFQAVASAPLPIVERAGAVACAPGTRQAAGWRVWLEAPSRGKGMTPSPTLS